MLCALEKVIQYCKTIDSDNIGGELRGGRLDKISLSYNVLLCIQHFLNKSELYLSRLSINIPHKRIMSC